MLKLKQNSKDHYLLFLMYFVYSISFQDMVNDIKMEDYDFNNEINDEQKFDLEEDQHICLICNTTFTLQEDLLRHVAAKHNIKFECIACNELFISNMELKVKILNTEVDSNRWHCTSIFWSDIYSCTLVKSNGLYLRPSMASHNPVGVLKFEFSPIQQGC